MVRIGRRQREARLAELEAFRLVRRAAHEDVTTFGEELSNLHVETLTSELDDTMRGDYEQALDAYERAKAQLSAAGQAPDITAVTRTLTDGRFAHACVLADRDGSPRPTRREPCFFNPAHGPARHDVEWAPPGGVPRAVPVCFRDLERLTAGEAPDVRLVRLGNRRAPWFAAGPAYAAWAQGWYADLVDDNRMAADRLTMAYATGRGDSWGAAGAVAWSDPGAWDSGGMIGGHDYSGWHGDGGGFDGGGGGGDGGGGDGGGGGGDG
jgi:hypothetical protein